MTILNNPHILMNLINTIKYGINSSPFLATQTLYQLAEDEGESCPVAARFLRHHIYVDDKITGADTLEEVTCLQSQVIDLLKRDGFELRKWAWNAPELLNIIPQTHLKILKFLQNSDLPYFSVLGLQCPADTLT